MHAADKCKTLLLGAAFLLGRSLPDDGFVAKK